MLMVNMKEYMTSGHMWNVYKSHIMAFLNYDYRAHWCFMASGKKIMTSDHMWKIKYNMPAFIFDCVFMS